MSGRQISTFCRPRYDLGQPETHASAALCPNSSVRGSISRGAGQQYGGVNGVNGARTGYVSDHRYHANVLEALNRSDNPLHEVLGRGDVRQQLARAKVCFGA